MKSNYVTPQVILFVVNEDVITASSDLESIEQFDERWLELD